VGRFLQRLLQTTSTLYHPIAQRVIPSHDSTLATNTAPTPLDTILASLVFPFPKPADVNAVIQALHHIASTATCLAYGLGSIPTDVEDTREHSHADTAMTASAQPAPVESAQPSQV
jgi:hypothetical protein